MKIKEAYEAMDETITFVEDCEKEQKIHTELAEKIVELIVKDAKMLIKEFMYKKRYL